MESEQENLGFSMKKLPPEKRFEYFIRNNGESMGYPSDNTYPSQLSEEIFKNEERVNPTIESSGAPKDARRSIAYEAAQMVLTKWRLICVNGRVLIYNHQYGFFEEHSDRDLAVLVRRSVTKTIDKHLDVPKMRDVLYRLQSDPTLQIESVELDGRTDLINFRNGVYDIYTGQMLPHSPDWRFTNFIDADYRPLDENEGAIFLQFLEDCTGGDIGKRNSLQEVVGYIISNEWRAKKFFALIGLPHTGKSVWLAIWKSLIGVRFTTSMSLQQLGKNRFMSSELLGSKLNLSAEMDELGTLSGVALIKSITGGDMLTAERKGRDPFHFYPKTKLVAAGNHMPLPEGSDGTNAFVDRILFVIFDHSVPEHERDKELIPKLLLERDFIVSWAIEGLYRLLSNNLVFTESDAGKAFRHGYTSEKDSVASFITDCCDVHIGDEDYREHRRDLADAYKIYCQKNCLRAISATAFINQLINEGYTPHKFRLNGSVPLRGFLGIRLKSENKETQREAMCRWEDE